MINYKIALTALSTGGKMEYKYFNPSCSLNSVFSTDLLLLFACLLREPFLEV